jgi:small subunit ribosomal protein S8e
MARSSARSKRKYTGKKYKRFRKKRKRELERPTMDTVIGDDKKKEQRTLGGNTNAASKDLNRRHILTKGAVVETELGNAKITSRPGQHGTLNGILISS